MTPSNAVLPAGYSFLLLLGIVSIAWEAVYRLTAGPIRFRHPLASMANPPPRLATANAIPLVLCVLLSLPAMIFSADPSDLVPPIFCLWVVVNNLQAFDSRRDARRRLVIAAGSLGSALGAVLLAGGLGLFRSGEGSVFGLPRALMPGFSSLLFVVGAAMIQESLSGTLVRERGLEIMGTTHPWSRVIVKDGHERDGDGGLALRLSLLCPRLFGMPYRPDVEMIIPIPAAERPAPGAFLAEHAATTD